MVDELDLDQAAAAASVAVEGAGQFRAWALASIALWLVTVVVTTLLGLARGRDGAAPRPSLAALPPSLRMLAVLVVFSLLVVQALAAIDAYVQTRVINTSAREYFQYLSWARLLGTSHAHVFGYTIMYGLLAFLMTLTSASEVSKCALISILLWSGTFDVLSWWGIKRFSGDFEWLSAVTGAATALSSLLCFSLVLRSAWTRKEVPHE